MRFFSKLSMRVFSLVVCLVFSLDAAWLQDLARDDADDNVEIAAREDLGRGTSTT